MVFPAAKEILSFWLGDAVEGDDDALQAAFARWFKGGEAVDEIIRARFGARVESALSGQFAEWETDIHARLALVILLDQFPRNIFRHTRRAFAGDERALMLAREAVRNGDDQLLAPIERVFLLMPYQHAEDRAVQEESVQQFTRLAAASASRSVSAFLETTLDYARQHRDIIERFGRFPYRNEAMGRESSEAEKRWLEHGARFGQ